MKQVFNPSLLIKFIFLIYYHSCIYISASIYRKSRSVPWNHCSPETDQISDVSVETNTVSGHGEPQGLNPSQEPQGKTGLRIQTQACKNSTSEDSTWVQTRRKFRGQRGQDAVEKSSEENHWW